MGVSTQDKRPRKLVTSLTPSAGLHLPGFTPVLLQLIFTSEVAVARISCILLTRLLQYLEIFCMTTGVLGKSSG